MDLGEIGWDNMDWICLAQDRDKWRALENAVINLQFLCCTTGGLSISVQLQSVKN
jgi:hypothetical protein